MTEPKRIDFDNTSEFLIQQSIWIASLKLEIKSHEAELRQKLILFDNKYHLGVGEKMIDKFIIDNEKNNKI